MKAAKRPIRRAGQVGIKAVSPTKHAVYQMAEEPPIPRWKVWMFAEQAIEYCIGVGVPAFEGLERLQSEGSGSGWALHVGLQTRPHDSVRLNQSQNEKP